MRKILTIAGIVLAGLIVLSLITGPLIAEWYLEKNSKELIGRKVTIGGIRINYLNGGIRIREFAVYEQNDQDKFFSFDRLKVNVGILKSLSNNIVISRILLDSMNVKALQDGETFNFDDLIERFSSAEDTVEEVESDEPGFLDKYTLTFKNTEVRNGKAVYKDVDYDEDISLENINFRLPEFTIGSNSSLMNLDLDFRKGGSLETRFLWDEENRVFELDVDLDSLSLEGANIFISKQDYYNIQDIDGRFSQQVHVTGNPKRILASKVTGELLLEDFELIDDRGTRFFTVDRVRFELDSANLVEKYVDVHYLSVRNMATDIEIYEGGNTLMDLVDWPDSTEAEIDSIEMVEEETEEEEIAIQHIREDAGNLLEYTKSVLGLDSFDVMIDSIVMRNSEFVMNDVTMSQPFKLSMEDIYFKAESIGTHDRKFKMESRAVINKSAEMEFVAKTLPSDSLAMDIKFNLVGLNLQDFTPYMLHYTGSPVESGEFVTYTNAQIRGKNLASLNEIDFNQISLGKKQQKGVYNLPFKFAISLLRNQKGNVELDIPVEGSIDDPDFRLGKEIFQGVMNAMVNVITSPFRFLANSFGMKEEDLKEIQFSYLETKLDEKSNKTVSDLQKILSSKKGINLEFMQYTDAEEETKLYSLFNAKRAYYLDQNNMRETDLTLEDSFRIRDMPSDDTLFIQYVNLQIDDRELDLYEKAVRLAGGEETLKEGLLKIVEERNRYLQSYFDSVETMGQRYQIITSEFDTLTSINKRPHFGVSVVPGSEGDEEALPEDEASAGTLPEEDEENKNP